MGAAAAPVFGSDDLALVLAAGGESGSPVGSSSDGARRRLATAEDVTVLRSGLALLDPSRGKRLVLDAVASSGEDGLRRLATALQLLVDVRDDVRWPPPVRLSDLEAICLRATALDPAPPSPPPPLAEPVLAPTMPARRPQPPRPAWATPRSAPAARHLIGARADPFDYDDVALAVDRQAIGELELVLPRTPDELTTWGRLLANCLGDFGAAVADHRSVIVGVRQRGVLVAALELRPSERRVVQFLGVNNRIPPVRLTSAVLTHLEERSLVRTQGSAQIVRR